MLYSAGGADKSTLAAQWARSLQAGQCRLPADDHGPDQWRDAPVVTLDGGPGESAGVWNVLWVTTGGEDPAHVTRTRFERSDVSAVVQDRDERRYVTLEALDSVPHAIAEYDVVVVDSMAGLGSGVDLNDGAGVKAFLGKVSQLAERTETSWLILGHPRKGRGIGVEKLAGSIQASASCRVVLHLARDGDELTVTCEKNNIGKIGWQFVYRSVWLDGEQRLVYQGTEWITSANDRKQEETAARLRSAADSLERATVPGCELTVGEAKLHLRQEGASVTRQWPELLNLLEERRVVTRVVSGKRTLALLRTRPDFSQWRATVTRHETEPYAREMAEGP